MPVDTAAKRYSLLGLALDSLRLRDIPDGAVQSRADRQHLLPLYRGIPLDEPAVLRYPHPLIRGEEIPSGEIEPPGTPGQLDFSLPANSGHLHTIGL